MTVVTRDRLITAAILAAIIGGVYYYEKSKAPSSGNGTIPATLVKGGVYQFTVPIVAGSDPNVTAMAVMTNGPIWQNVSASASGNQLLVRGTYVGQDGAPNGGLTKVG